MRRKSGITKLFYLNLVICLFISVILTGCTSSGNDQASGQQTGGQEDQSQEPSKDSPSMGPTKGGTLKMIMLDTATNIGYPADDSGFTLYYNMPALERLGRYDKEGKMTPFLAESWQTDLEKKTITIKLKQGIKFHDDTDFNAEAVKWNIEQYQAAKRPEVSGIQSMDVIDAHTLRLNLEQWDSTLLESVAQFVHMVSPAAVEKNGKDWAKRNPVGTGPFKFVSWERDVSMKFKKNENYWQKGKPYLDAIEYSLIYDRNTAANVFKSGGADVLTQMTIDTYLELEQSGKYPSNSIKDIFGRLGIGIMFDSAKPGSPFTDIRVRQAVMYAIDTQAIISSVYRGKADETNQWYTSSSPFYNKDVKGFPYDPEKAKQLLAEAGYPNGFKTKITTSSAYVNGMTAVQSYLAKVGINAELVTVDIAKLLEQYAGTWDGMRGME
jgi:peptide/nickel transport system substrate-binding protein